MQLGTDAVLPCVGGNKLCSIQPNESVIAVTLNLRFSKSVMSCYGYSIRNLLREIERLLKWLSPQSEVKDVAAISTVSSLGSSRQEKVSETISNGLPADAWVTRVTSNEQYTENIKDSREFLEF